MASNSTIRALIHKADLEALVSSFVARRPTEANEPDGLELFRAIWSERKFENVHWAAPVGVSTEELTAALLFGVMRAILHSTEIRDTSSDGLRYAQGLVLLLYMLFQTQWHRGSERECYIRLSPTLWERLCDIATGDARGSSRRVRRDVITVLHVLLEENFFVPTMALLQVTSYAEESGKSRKGEQAHKSWEPFLIDDRGPVDGSSLEHRRIGVSPVQSESIMHAQALVEQSSREIFPSDRLASLVRAYRVAMAAPLLRKEPNAARRGMEFRRVDGSLEIDAGKILGSRRRKLDRC